MDEPKPHSPSVRSVLIGFVALVGVPVVILVDMLRVKLASWWTSSDLPQVLVALSSTVILVGVLLLASGAGRRRLVRIRARLVLGIVTFTVCWLLVEGLVAWLFGPQLWFHRHIPSVVREVKIVSEAVPGVWGNAVHTMNKLGLRGPELPATREAAWRVLCIGGSTTACVALDDHETWPRLVMEKLNRFRDSSKQALPQVYMVDAGKSGYGTWHHVRLLEDEALIREFDCLLFLVGINDFMRALQQRQVFSPYGVRPLYEQSGIFTLLHNAYQQKKQIKENRDESNMAVTLPFRRDSRQAATKVATLPDLGSWLADYRTNVRTLIDNTRRLGATPVFMTQPVLWREDLDAEGIRLLWLGEMSAGKVLSLAGLREGITLFNDVLRDECKQRGVPCIDLSELHGNRELFYDDCHFTEEGARRVGSVVSQWFEERGWPLAK